MGVLAVPRCALGMREKAWEPDQASWFIPAPNGATAAKTPQHNTNNPDITNQIDDVVSRPLKSKRLSLSPYNHGSAQNKYNKFNPKKYI
jgi:hypothetical protein